MVWRGVRLYKNRLRNREPNHQSRLLKGWLLRGEKKDATKQVTQLHEGGRAGAQDASRQLQAGKWATSSFLGHHPSTGGGGSRVLRKWPGTMSAKSPKSGSLSPWAEKLSYSLGFPARNPSASVGLP